MLAQGEYAVLQKKYRAIKQQRMEELEALMTEQQQRVSTLFLHTGTDTQGLQPGNSFQDNRNPSLHIRGPRNIVTLLTACCRL